MMHDTIRVCTRCVMDSTIKAIEFDEHGVCNYCKTYEHRVATELYKEPERSERLHALIRTMKEEGKNKTYDCIIGVSGGVDSSYIAHLVHEFGLRALAVHLDNGWNSELAVKNIQLLLDKLHIDLYTHVIDWEAFKDLQKAFIKSSIENLEIPTDHAITALLLQTADKHGVRYILNGSNLVTEGILPVHGGRGIDDRLLKDIHKKFGTQKLSNYPVMSIWSFAYKVLVRRIKYLPILNYMDYDKEATIRLLEEKYGWKRYGGKHYESIFTRFFQGYLLPMKYGYDKRKAHFSTLIMSSQMSREEALQELTHNPYPSERLLEEDKAFFLKKFDFTEEEFEHMMKQCPKVPSDFNSYERLFETLKPLMLKIKEYAKGN